MMMDTALQKREREGRFIRVGMVGAGATSRAIALQLASPVPGMRLVAIANRTPANAERAFCEAGIAGWTSVSSPAAADDAIARGIAVLTDDPSVVTGSETIDLVVEVTGTVEPAAHVVLDAFDHGKHVVLVNCELDSLLGPILKAKADSAGLVLTNTDGDEPGVAMTLFRYLRSLGLRAVAAGNIKGMVDYYRTPETQRAFAAKFDQDVKKITSFADATKLSMETTVLANATGFHVGRRGMYGPSCSYVREMSNLLPADQMLATGLVDYSVGAMPKTGAWVIVHEDSPLKKAQLSYYRLGDGPFFVFYTPYHLPYMQIASTIGRAMVHHDATVAPIDGPVCEVVTVAKRDLKKGECLDGIGGFCCYGLIDNTQTARSLSALPISLSEGCVLHRDIPKDDVISFYDVDLPSLGLVGALWLEQIALWPDAAERREVPVSDAPKMELASVEKPTHH
jgi:predicted homoserine dehydrogenase-like protein